MATNQPQRQMSRRSRYNEGLDFPRNFFQEFFNRNWLDPDRWGGSTNFNVSWIPPVESYMDQNKFHIRVGLAGVKPEDVNLQVTGNEITISGERKQESELSEDQTYQCEFSYGTFARVIPLPDGVQPEKIEAHYQDGVLQITAPLSEKSMPRRIEIQGSESGKQKLAA